MSFNSISSSISTKFSYNSSKFSPKALLLLYNVENQLNTYIHLMYFFYDHFWNTRWSLQTFNFNFNYFIASETLFKLPFPFHSNFSSSLTILTKLLLKSSSNYPFLFLKVKSTFSEPFYYHRKRSDAHSSSSLASLPSFYDFLSLSGLLSTFHS